MSKISIQDLYLIKIKKVTSWKIYFDYDNKHYMLIDDTDEDCHISLYERELSNNKVRLNFISGKITCSGIGQFIRDISKKKPEHPVYTNIDREYFVKALVSLGFSSGLFEEEYNNKVNEITKLREQIREIETRIYELNGNWKRTSNHGSKCYGLKLKTKVAERIKAAKPGDWCEQYKDYYGNTHPKYGGVLTDLFSLSVGTQFHVCNGCYNAMISVDEHGDKCVITDCTCLKLTKENHSLYIK